MLRKTFTQVRPQWMEKQVETFHSRWPFGAQDRGSETSGSLGGGNG